MNFYSLDTVEIRVICDINGHIFFLVNIKIRFYHGNRESCGRRSEYMIWISTWYLQAFQRQRVLTDKRTDNKVIFKEFFFSLRVRNPKTHECFRDFADEAASGLLVLFIFTLPTNYYYLNIFIRLFFVFRNMSFEFTDCFVFTFLGYHTNKLKDSL